MKLKMGILLLSIMFSVCIFAANEPITVTIDSLSNISGNGALEVCGKAVHKDGKRPILVTIKHDQSYYTTLTAKNDVWCIVYKRWTSRGQVEVTATELLNSNSVQSNTVTESLN